MAGTLSLCLSLFTPSPSIFHSSSTIFLVIVCLFPFLQRYFTLGYLNKHEGHVLLAWAETFSELGRQKAKKNAWSGESYTLEQATIVNINTQQMELQVTVQERGKPKAVDTVTVDLGKFICLANDKTILIHVLTRIQNERC